MKRFVLAVIILVTLPDKLVLAQQSQRAGSQVSEDVRLTCRASARKICNPGTPPDVDAFRRCVVANGDQLPKECAPLVAAVKQGGS